ncbi:MAG: crossover junction endodeoxyribonuclease RuvC [Acidobacteriota bacterium]
MRILGIDPGSRHTGYGVIEASGRRLAYVDAGAISPRLGAPFSQRLLAIYQSMTERIEALRPSQVAVEDLFHSVNSRSALRLAHVRGVLILAAGAAGLAVTAYAPAAIKKAVVGSGNAAKEQVAWMVSRLLEKPMAHRTLDTTDALAVAICHASHLGPGPRRNGGSGRSAVGRSR